MGFPASGNEKYYRNPIDEISKCAHPSAPPPAPCDLTVIRFYEYYHADNYKLYNLCAEREYDYSLFHNRVSRYPFYDHNAPSVQLIQDCCNDIDQWLKESDQHIVGINCKAGKGAHPLGLISPRFPRDHSSPHSGPPFLTPQVALDSSSVAICFTRASARRLRRP